MEDNDKAGLAATEALVSLHNTLQTLSPSFEDELKNWESCVEMSASQSEYLLTRATTHLCLGFQIVSRPFSYGSSFCQMSKMSKYDSGLSRFECGFGKRRGKIRIDFPLPNPYHVSALLDA